MRMTTHAARPAISLAGIILIVVAMPSSMRSMAGYTIAVCLLALKVLAIAEGLPTREIGRGGDRVQWRWGRP